MCRWASHGVLVLLVALTVVPSEAARVSPVQKVLQLLDELRGKVSADLAAESQEMDEYMTYSHKVLEEKNYAIHAAGKFLEQLDAKIFDCQGTIETCEAQISLIGNAIAGKDGEIMEANKLRDAQRQDFESAETQLLRAIDEAHGAADQIKKVMSFVQTKGKGKNQDAQSATEMTEKVRSTLETIVDSASVIAGFGKEHLKSLLQAHTEESDDLSLKARLRQPQPSDPGNYESQSGGVLQAVKGTEEKAEKQLGDLRKAELQNGHAFELLAAGLNDELNHLKEKLATQTSLKQATTQTLGETQDEEVQTQTTKADDEKFVASLKMESSEKGKQFETRHKSASGEIAALDKAKQILSQGVTALVEVTSTRSKAMNRGDDRRLRLARSLRDMGRRYHSFKLVQLASAAATDPFGKIRGLISDMIDKLKSAAADDATHNAFCEAEMEKNTKSRSKKEQQRDEHQVRISDATASIAQLTEAVRALTTQIGEIDAGQAEAQSIRSKEHAENTQAASDFSGSADAVVAAVATLKSYYNGVALLQVHRQSSLLHARALQPDFGSASTDAGNAIISILEYAGSEFTQLLAETESAEATAKSDYENLTQQNALSRAQKETEVKSKKSQVGQLKVFLSHQQEDHDVVEQELATVLKYADKLKVECSSKVDSYAERKAAREAEIDGLREAVSILEGV